MKRLRDTYEAKVNRLFEFYEADEIDDLFELITIQELDYNEIVSFIDERTRQDYHYIFNHDRRYYYPDIYYYYCEYILNRNI